jgi:transposase
MMLTIGAQAFLSLGSAHSEKKSLMSNRWPKAPSQNRTKRVNSYSAGRKASFNRSTHNAPPAMLLQIIKTKAEEAGSWFSLADTKIVKLTQCCHCCGTLVKKELDDR